MLFLSPIFGTSRVRCSIVVAIGAATGVDDGVTVDSVTSPAWMNYYFRESTRLVISFSTSIGGPSRSSVTVWLGDAGRNRYLFAGAKIPGK